MIICKGIYSSILLPAKSPNIFSRKCFFPINQLFFVSSIRQSLKILQISTPTTKQVIKKKYISLAKKYHPDSSQTDKKTKDAQLKQMQHKFVNITKAYQYLRQFSEEQINLNKQKQKVLHQTASQQQIKPKMTKQQKRRQQTYQYFNRKTYKTAAPKQQQISKGKQKVSLIRAVPEIFIGFLILAFIFGDWIFNVSRNAKNKPIEQQQVLPNKHKDAFKSMNPYRRFGDGSLTKVTKVGDIERQQITQN